MGKAIVEDDSTSLPLQEAPQFPMYQEIEQLNKQEHGVSSNCCSATILVHVLYVLHYIFCG